MSDSKFEGLEFAWWEEVAAARQGQMKPLIASLKVGKEIKPGEWKDVSAFIADCLQGKFKRPGKPPEWDSKTQKALRYFETIRRMGYSVEEALEQSARLTGVAIQKIRNLQNRPKGDRRRGRR